MISLKIQCYTLEILIICFGVFSIFAVILGCKTLVYSSFVSSNMNFFIPSFKIYSIMKKRLKTEHMKVFVVEDEYH